MQQNGSRQAVYVRDWPPDRWLLGRVREVNLDKDYGLLIAYDAERSQVLLYPDGKPATEVWFRLSGLSVNVEDWVVFIPEDAPEDQRGRYSDYSIRAQKASVRPVQEILQGVESLPEFDSDTQQYLRDNLLDDVIILGQRIFIIKAYADAIRQQVQEEEEKKNETIREDLSEQIDRAEERERIANNQSDIAKRHMKEADEEKEKAQALLQEAHALQQKNDDDRMLLVQKLQRWGLTEVKSAKADSEPPALFNGTESELIETVQRYMAAKDFKFSRAILSNFYTCLQAAPFTVLAGLSGTGKSSLPRLFAEAIDAKYVPISVKATWTDDADLLGFYHPVEMFYFDTPFTHALACAAAEPDRLFLICLDEMNLSRVEYYFAAMLNLLDLEKRDLPLYSQGEYRRREANLQEMKQRLAEADYSVWESNFGSYPSLLPVPPNVLLCGTVNVDETTHPFSDKVLDRVQILQFEDLDQGEIVEKDDKRVHLSYQQFQQYQPQEGESNLAPPEAFFTGLYQILRPSGFHFGHRVQKQIKKYYAHAMQSGLWTTENSNSDKQILDLQIVQKVLPKIKGIRRGELTHALFENLKKFCATDYPTSLGKVQKLAGMDSINYWLTFRYDLPD